MNGIASKWKFMIFNSFAGFNSVPICFLSNLSLKYLLNAFEKIPETKLIKEITSVKSKRTEQMK